MPVKVHPVSPEAALTPRQSVQVEAMGAAPQGPALSCNLLLLSPTWAVARRSKGYSQGSRGDGILGTSPVQEVGCRKEKSGVRSTGRC